MGVEVEKGSGRAISGLAVARWLPYRIQLAAYIGYRTLFAPGTIL